MAEFLTAKYAKYAKKRDEREEGGGNGKGYFDHGWTRINTDGENRRWVPKAEEAFVTGGWWKLPVSM
jgi:hypothetical protein